MEKAGKGHWIIHGVKGQSRSTECGQIAAAQLLYGP